ncbi:MAG: hypothetical protein LBT47_05420 [Deltaproteobacteria bacterium]|jgi:hypothetical protein|nr:hypothetical protein [Deltaproteobacteria bacterium]
MSLEIYEEFKNKKTIFPAFKVIFDGKPVLKGIFPAELNQGRERAKTGAKFEGQNWPLVVSKSAADSAGQGWF